MPMIMNAGNDARMQTSIDDAQRKGITSPAGIFNLLSELDYYALLERLIRGPITAKQIVTSMKYWLYLRGTALAFLASAILLILRTILLTTGTTVNADFKYCIFLLIYVFSMYRIALIFSNYFQYTNGITWAASQQVLNGYISGMYLFEFLKITFMIVTVIAKNYIILHFYGKYEVLNTAFEMYYTDFLCIKFSFVFEAICTILALYYGKKRFVLKTQKIDQQNKDGLPYELLSSEG